MEDFKLDLEISNLKVVVESTTGETKAIAIRRLVEAVKKRWYQNEKIKHMPNKKKMALRAM